jgi:glyoxylase-like metal-dependent hydrolase (beta-lactamase superfamily II)
MSEATQRWQIGEATLTALVESESHGVPPQFFFPDATADDVRSADWLVDDASADPAAGTVALRVQAFVIELRGRTVLIDPCVGNGKPRKMPFWNNLALPWLDRFHDAGFREADIDLVVHTHLHEDHLGWDTHMMDGTWVPTFSSARHVYVGNELDWAAAPETRAREDSYSDSIEPIIRAGLADVVDATADLGGGLRLLSTPGHTPGHVSLEIDTGGEPLIISGDLMHHQLQASLPHLAEIGDVDASLARETRHAFLDQCCRAGSLVAGTHFAMAPVGRFEVHGNAWRFRSQASTA